MSIESTPTEEQIATLRSLPMEAPIAALNLFKFNERAQYRPEDPEFGTPDADVSGQEAFARYSAEAGAKLKSLGGRTVFASSVDQLMIGPEALEFDLAAIMYFPTRSAFIEMLADPEFQSISRHRYAAFAKHSMLHIAGDPFIDVAT